VSGEPVERQRASGWPSGDAPAVVALVLAFGAPALLGLSRTVQTPLLETTPATVVVAIAMSVSVAIFRLIEPRRAGLRVARDGTLGPGLYLFIACLWLLCPIISVVRLADEPSPFGVAAVVVQLAAIAVMFHHARSSAT
jgi:hypothetical protein